MLRNKKICIFFLFSVFCIFGVVAQTTSADLVERQLDKADKALDDGNLVDACKYVTSALKLSKTSEYDVINANVLTMARQIYRQRLLQLKTNYDEPSFIEIKTNLETFSEVGTSELTKLVRQIEAQLVQEEKAENKKNQQEFYDKINESTESMNTAVSQIGEQIAKSNETTQDAVIQIGEQLKESSKNSDKKFTLMLLMIVGIAVVILIVVFLIILIVRAAAKHNIQQQQTYAEAFKLLAQNQSQTNRLMIGGIAGLYSEDGLKLASDSSWSQSALPPPEETPEEKEELQELAQKCEALGAKIDQRTSRKNNSKNVSELVYKLASRLGCNQHEAMVYFCAAMVYDAGFLGIDEELLAAENLTEEQRDILHDHVNKSENYLQFVPRRYWDVFENAAKYHHENMDGSGMPEGLKGDAIPKIARIIRVADSFNALSSRRSYRGGTDKESAIEKLEEQPNIYDPDVIMALKDII